MSALLLEPPYWNWWLLGLLLIILEVVLPGTFLLWLGIAALLTGLVVLLAPTLSGPFQWLVFGLLALASVACWWLYFKRNPLPRSNDPLLNRRADQYIGRVFTLETAIVNGRGKLRVDDSLWRIEGVDCTAGVRVRVTGVEGTLLRVEPEA